MTVFLVGEHNPYGADPQYALFPRPAGSAGARLCKVLGLGELEYLRRFERRNLLVGDRSGFRWSAPRAREAAHLLLLEARGGDALVLLGARVSAAFGFDFAAALLQRGDMALPRAPSLGGGVACALVMPHPSGRSRLWNAPGTAARVRTAVEGFLPPVGKIRHA